jgi:hypothetical protein
VRLSVPGLIQNGASLPEIPPINSTNGSSWRTLISFQYHQLRRPLFNVVLSNCLSSEPLNFAEFAWRMSGGASR